MSDKFQMPKLKSQNFGLGTVPLPTSSSPFCIPPRLHPTAFRAPHCMSALADYRNKRENGTRQDEPDYSFPKDGEYVWNTPDERYSKVRYDEGPKDRAWMEEKDRNYIARLRREHEQTLRQREQERKEQQEREYREREARLKREKEAREKAQRFLSSGEEKSKETEEQVVECPRVTSDSLSIAYRDITLSERLGGRSDYTIAEQRPYLLKLTSDGIYLYKKTEPTEELAAAFSAGLSLREEPKHPDHQIPVNKQYSLLLKITLMGSSYDLLFAIVDAIVNRSLQRNFNFENDLYANHLRIMFGMLVPKLYMESCIGYLKPILQNQSAMTLDINGFMAIKTLLDSDERYKTKNDKMDFFGINLPDSTLQLLDDKLQEALEQYYSDDSDEAESSDTDDESTRTPFRIPETSEIALKDMQTLNEFLQNRNPETSSLDLTEDNKIRIREKILSTDFVIPGFRGINYMPLRFSDEARRLYRSSEFQKQRVQMPYYSEAVLMSHFDFYRDIEGIRKHLLPYAPHALEDNAKTLEARLLGMRDNDYILATSLSNGGQDDVRLFSNRLYFLQHLYSNGIIKCQRLLFKDLQEGGFSFAELSAYNPFVSESEAPRHALKYAFGQKNLYLPAALHPHYDSTGKPSFPYVGEIFISLRGAEVFTSQRERHQLRKLERLHKVNPTYHIGPEMEITGFAWLPKGEVVFSTVIKCPNFAGHWKNKYKDKYGFNKEKFHQFRDCFSSANNRNARLHHEAMVIELLINHNSDKLLQRATKYVADKRQTLTFLNADGTLGVTIPQRSKNDADKKAKESRRTLELELKKVQHVQLIIEAKLTTKILRVYSLKPEVVEQAIKALTEQDPAQKESYKQFMLEEERLRTPPQQKSVSRTSSAEKEDVAPRYSYSGSPGTPLHFARTLSRHPSSPIPFDLSSATSPLTPKRQSCADVVAGRGRLQDATQPAQSASPAVITYKVCTKKGLSKEQATNLNQTLQRGKIANIRTMYQLEVINSYELEITTYREDEAQKAKCIISDEGLLGITENLPSEPQAQPRPSPHP